MKKLFDPPIYALAMSVLLMSATPSLAHHSSAMFDRSQKQTIAGTLKELQWTNPHIYFWVYVDDGKGGQDLYSIEGGSPHILTRLGWNKRFVSPGDKVVMEINPLKDGRTGGYFISITRPDGKKLENAETLPPVTAASVQ